MEGFAAEVLGPGNWLIALTAAVHGNLMSQRYNGHLLKHLLRAIRNKWRHRAELPAEVRQEYGCTANEFYRCASDPSAASACFMRYTLFSSAWLSSWFGKAGAQKNLTTSYKRISASGSWLGAR